MIVSERSNFPTDLYIAESAAPRRTASSCAWSTRDGIADALDDDVAVLMLTHVNYRTGRMHDMADADARRARSRRAVGLGPGALGRRGAGRPARRATPTSRSAAATSTSTAAPARRRSSGRIRATPRAWTAQLRQPLSGWLGHAAPFEFTPDYRPARRHRALRLRHAADPGDGARSSAASTCFAAAEPLGGMAALRAQVARADRPASSSWSRRAAPATAWRSSTPRDARRSAAAR